MKPPPTREELEAKVDSMRPGSPVPPAKLADEDVTGVIALAVERVADAGAVTRSTLEASLERIAYERDQVFELTRAINSRPPNAGR